MVCLPLREARLLQPGSRFLSRKQLCSQNFVDVFFSSGVEITHLIGGQRLVVRIQSCPIFLNKKFSTMEFCPSVYFVGLVRVARTIFEGTAFFQFPECHV